MFCFVQAYNSMHFSPDLSKLKTNKTNKTDKKKIKDKQIFKQVNKRNKQTGKQNE